MLALPTWWFPAETCPFLSNPKIRRSNNNLTKSALEAERRREGAQFGIDFLWTANGSRHFVPKQFPKTPTHSAYRHLERGLGRAQFFRQLRARRVPLFAGQKDFNLFKDRL